MYDERGFKGCRVLIKAMFIKILIHGYNLYFPPSFICHIHCFLWNEAIFVTNEREEEKKKKKKLKKEGAFIFERYKDI